MTTAICSPRSLLPKVDLQLRSGEEPPRSRHPHLPLREGVREHRRDHEQRGRDGEDADAHDERHGKDVELERRGKMEKACAVQVLTPSLARSAASATFRTSR